jgi:hypothetical protein
LFLIENPLATFSGWKKLTTSEFKELFTSMETNFDQVHLTEVKNSTNQYLIIPKKRAKGKRQLNLPQSQWRRKNGLW